MIGLILIYFIGRQYYFLAHDYQYNRWLYAILGIGSYYLGTMVFAFTIALLANHSEFFFDLAHSTPFVQGLISMPLGLLFCWIFFHLLRASWQKRKGGQFEVIDGEAAE